MLEPLDRSARAPRTKAPSSTSLRSPTQGFRRAARTFDDASSPSRTALSREGPDWPALAPGTAGRGFPHRGFSVCGHSNMFADTLDLIGALLALRAGVIGHASDSLIAQASASAARRANCACKRGTTKSTKARIFGTESRPCGVTTWTGKGVCSCGRSRIRSWPSRTCSTT